MANKDKKPEERIREAAEKGNIVFESSENIGVYDDIARDFLDKIFDINYDECFVSDRSALSDFASCCVPDDYEDDKSLSRQEAIKNLYEAGKFIMVKKIRAEYGIDVEPHDYLLDVFEQIWKRKTSHLN